MVAGLIKRGNGYICSECRMRQRDLQYSCWFCGKTFSNFESILCKETEEKLKDESNICRSTGIASNDKLR